jgi:hypothetical protein
MRQILHAEEDWRSARLSLRLDHESAAEIGVNKPLPMTTVKICFSYPGIRNAMWP